MELNRLECPICLDQYSHNRKPKLITGCGHSACMHCINSISKCPICRGPICSTTVNYALMEIATIDPLVVPKKETNNEPVNVNIDKKIQPANAIENVTNHINCIPNTNTMTTNETTNAFCELTKEQLKVSALLNVKIEQIISSNIDQNDLNCQQMPVEIYKHSVGLCGRGGVGKTHLLVEIINFWANIKKRKVCYVASTHNAVDVMRSMLNKQNVIQTNNLQLSTFCKLIRRNVCIKNKLELAKTADYLSLPSNFQLVGYFDLIIIDESSMMRVQDLLDLMLRINEEKIHNKMTSKAFPCFLFSGDYRQLGPIDEKFMPANCWNNVISHVLFSNVQKSHELQTIMRSSNSHIQNLCDSVGMELESNFKKGTLNFSLNNYTKAKAVPCVDDSVRILANAQDAMSVYADMMVGFNLNTVWIHVNNAKHSNTIDLTREIRQKYYLQLHQDESDENLIIKDYFVGEYFSYDNNFLSFDSSKQLQAKNPYLNIDLPACTRSNYFDRDDFFNQNFFDIVSNRNLVRLNASNIKVNERFKIVHAEESKKNTKSLFQDYGNIFAKFACVDYNHEIKETKLYLISNLKTDNECMVLNKYDLVVDYGTYSAHTKMQIEISIKYLNEKIWHIESCSYKDYKTKYSPILKLFDFEKIFPITYVNSIQTFQGSSVDNVFVGEYNLKEARHLSGIGIFTHLYTALSRAKKRIFIVE